jgi:diadenosine tetraphosphate (Ap4A) HIT family hydrolase
MSSSEDSCPFCDLDPARVLEDNKHARALRDGYPVTELHTLVIPKRHVATYFDLTDEDRQSIHELLQSQQEKIKTEDSSVEGFNIGWNCGEVAGQTVFHAHVHLIPRREGDVENPRGGVRHLMPCKGEY